MLIIIYISFKKVKTIILKKLSKLDYLKIKINRPITLLYILNKILKIIIIKILNNYIKEYSFFLN